MPKKVPESIPQQILNLNRALTAKELARILNVSPLTIERRARKGLIPCFRVGSLVRYDPASICNWLHTVGLQTQRTSASKSPAALCAK